MESSPDAKTDKNMDSTMESSPEINRDNEMDSTKASSPENETTSKIESSREDYLLERIAALEKKNKELEEKMKKSTVYPIPSVTSTDVYDNLKRLQDNFMERFGHHFDAYRTGFDLRPFLDLVQKSRGLENAISLAPPRKRQMFACITTFLLLPMSMFITLATVLLALYSRSPLLLSLCVLYGSYIYMDQKSCESGAKGLTWFKQHRFWKSLRSVARPCHCLGASVSSRCSCAPMTLIACLQLPPLPPLYVQELFPRAACQAEP